MDRGRLSIASVAVDVARGVFDHFGDKTVLVIGAGKMAELTLRHLAALRPGRHPGDQPEPRARRGGRRAPGAARPSPGTIWSGPWSRPTWSSAPRPSAEPIVSFDQYRPGPEGAGISALVDPGHRRAPRLRPADQRAGDGEPLQRRRPPGAGRRQPQGPAPGGRVGRGDRPRGDRSPAPSRSATAATPARSSASSATTPTRSAPASSTASSPPARTSPRTTARRSPRPSTASRTSSCTTPAPPSAPPPATGGAGLLSTPSATSSASTTGGVRRAGSAHRPGIGGNRWWAHPTVFRPAAGSGAR